MNSQVKEVAVKGFYQFSKSSYYEALKNNMDYIEQFNIGLYYPSGGCVCEFSVTWVMLGEQVVANLSMYDDAWEHIDEFKDLLLALKEIGNHAQPTDIISKLIELGYENQTK